MNSERFALIGALFDQLVEVPAARRAARLAELTADPGIRRDVEALLAADERAAGFADQAQQLRDALAGSMPDDVEPLPTTQFGAWRALRELGRGGMGQVLLVERTQSGFEQRGALKRIRRGIASDVVIARFLRERQLLARLDHPHIARLLDGGVDAEGQPWFVMDHVDGEPLLAWCASHAPDIEQRLRCFDAICDAVAFAHRQLIVHRDIKPGNVLVTHDGQAKLLDFGIAKLIADELAPTDTATDMQAAPMTPQYASPEQLRGLPATTATDVYGLGAVLYELLCGQRPYAMGRDATPLEWLRVLDGPECVPPSAARSAKPASLPPIPSAVLRGDLDAIALTAVRREPERRYASVDALRADLAAWRHQLPVAARPDSRRYRLGKFIARHRAGVLAGSLAALGLIAASAVAIERAAAARQEAARAVAVQQFLVGLFDASDPELAQAGYRMNARDVVAAAAARIGTEFAEQPDVAAELSLAIGRVQFRLGDVEAAIARLHWEDTVGPVLAGSAEREVSRRRWLAEAYTATGKTALATAQIDRLLAIALARGELGLQADALRLRAEALRAQGQRSAGLDAARASLAVAERAQDPGILGRSLLVLGTALRETDHMGEARTTIERAIALLDGGSHVPAELRISARTELSAALLGANQLDAAAATLAQAQGIATADLPDSHPMMAEVLSQLGAVAAARGDLQAAIEAERAAVQILEKSVGTDSMLTGGHRSALAFALRRAGRPAEALDMYRQAIDTFRRSGNADHAYAINALGNAALLMDEAGDASGAEASARQALDASRRTLGERASGTASRMYTLSTLLRRHGRTDEALQLARAALAIDDSIDSLPRAVRVGGLRNAAQAHSAAGEHDQAAALFERAIEVSRNPPPADLLGQIDAQLDFAEALRLAGIEARALLLAQGSLALAVEVDPGLRTLRANRARVIVGELLVNERSQHTNARATLTDALTALEALDPPTAVGNNLRARARRALDGLQ